MVTNHISPDDLDRLESLILSRNIPKYQIVQDLPVTVIGLTTLCDIVLSIEYVNE